MNSQLDRALISICIPTYNRSKNLSNLLEILQEIKKRHRQKVEICISNNCSSDDTALVINEWCDELDLKVVTQDENIGCMKNCVKVASISTAKWILLIGDDDSINISNFDKLLQLIDDLDARWIFCGVGDPSGEEYLLNGLRGGLYSQKAIKSEVIKSGLHRFGFVGMHVFPGEIRDVFSNLKISQIESWPHLGLLMYQLSTEGNYFVYDSPVVIQAPNGNQLFWDIGDWIKVNLCKIKIVFYSNFEKSIPNNFQLILMLRELYSVRNIKEMIMWRILEPKSFYKDSFIGFFKIYRLFHYFAFFTLGHLVLLSLLHGIPARLLKLLLVLTKKNRFLNVYYEIKKQSSFLNGVSRGL